MSKRVYNVICGIGFMVLVIGASAIGGTIETHYNRNGVIDSINNDEIVILDTSGHEWVWITDDDTIFEIGQNVTMKMFNGCTDNTLDDDEILKIKGR